MADVSLSEKGLAKAKVRPAVTEDFDGAYPLLQELNNSRVTREVWQRLFTNLWQQPDWSPGYVLDNGDEIVGFIGAFYTKADDDKIICNLTSWIVRDEYRSNSIMLLMPFLKKKTLILSSLTSSPEAYSVYKKLGFKDLDSSARVIYPLPSFNRSIELITEQDKVRELLSEQERKCFDDHRRLDVFQCVIKSGERTCYLLLTYRLGRGHIQKVGDVELFKEAASAISKKLCREMGVKSLQVDERFLEGVKLFMSRTKVFPQAKQVKGNISLQKVDGAYSELTVLATP